MNNTHKLWITLLCALAVPVTGIATADTMTSTSYKISWDVTDGGGASMASVSYSLDDSVAQPSAIGGAASTSYVLQAGFHSPPDSDVDRVKDFMDNCTFDPNSSQYDSNGDGYGNLCDPDLDNNGVVNFIDYAALTAAFLSIPGDPNWNEDADLTGDNVVNFVDIALFAPFFLGVPGPSGIAP